MKKVVNTAKSDFDVQVVIVDAINNDMKLIVKNDNMNSKQITELEQSEGTKIGDQRILRK